MKMNPDYRWTLLPLLALLLSPSVMAEQHYSGPHYSDPEHSMSMPPSWQKEPIRYKDVPPGTDLSITLDQQLYPALLPLIADFAKERKLKIAVQEGTCGISSGALVDKKVDMGGFCCPAGESDRLPGLQFHTLGIGAIALLKNTANPVEDISTGMARRIYHGEVSTWEEAGGRKQPIPSISEIKTTARLHCKNRPGHWRLILDNEDQFSPTVQEVSTIEDMVGRVEQDADAIGYETLWMVKRYGTGKVATLKVDGIAPQDHEALAAGKYPFYRTFNITSWTNPALAREEITELVAYLKRHFPEVADKYGFIPAEQLRKAGWSFTGDELMAPPGIE